jgi:hypothetical protein
MAIINHELFKEKKYFWIFINGLNKIWATEKKPCPRRA